MSAEEITYAREDALDLDEFRGVLVSSGLAERRPDAPERLRAMLANANLVVTARDSGGRLVGVARSLTDFSFCCYCSDLAVNGEHKGRGIGRRLVEETRAAAGAGCTFLLLSAPGAMSYYPHIGLEAFDNCFGIRATE